jgi:hypothetical protein
MSFGSSLSSVASSQLLSSGSLISVNSLMRLSKPKRKPSDEEELENEVCAKSIILMSIFWLLNGLEWSLWHIYLRRRFLCSFGDLIHFNSTLLSKLSNDESSSSLLELWRFRDTPELRRPTHPSETINNDVEKNLRVERKSCILDLNSLRRFITLEIKTVRPLK